MSRRRGVYWLLVVVLTFVVIWLVGVANILQLSRVAP